MPYYNKLYTAIFQSTSPERGTTDVVTTNFAPESVFQSTSPERGTTGIQRLILSDTIFQSTSPERGTTIFKYNSCALSIFQSTSPERGTTTGIYFSSFFSNISIHVPRAGDDHNAPISKQATIDFNPRPPSGGRQNLQRYLLHYQNFNPRPPSGGRQLSTSKAARTSAFQSTSPERGTTANLLQNRLSNLGCFYNYLACVDLN